MRDVTDPSGHFAPRRCPDCAAENPAMRSVCWLCGAQLASQKSSAEENYYVTPVVVPEDETAANTFSSSLLLLFTLGVVCLGLFAIAPGLAFLLAILVLPAIVRTSDILGVRKRRGIQVTTQEKVRLFLGSIAMAITIFVAACVTFLAVCLGGSLGVAAILDPAVLGNAQATMAVALLVGLCIGSLAAVAMVISLARRSWPSRKDER